MEIDVVTVLFALVGVVSTGLGIWFWSKEMYRAASLAIGFGLLGLGAWLWSPAMCLGVFILMLVVFWIRLEAFGRLKTER